MRSQDGYTFLELLVSVAILAAIVFHVVLFVIQVPFEVSPPNWTAPERPVFAVQQLRFQQPEPVPQQAIPKPRKAVKRIPIPDPTPDDPEPRGCSPSQTSRPTNDNRNPPTIAPTGLPIPPTIADAKIGSRSWRYVKGL